MHTQLQLQENTTDPWMPCGYNVITEEVKINRFEDNFTSQFFAKLPDSEEYIAILERKLKKIKSNPNVLTQLSEKREACLEQLLMSETLLEQDQHTDFENSTSSIILKTIAPQKQALNPVELLELVKNDHLDTLQNKSSKHLCTEYTDPK